MVTKSGIYLPENANKERPHIYEVVAIGPGKKDKDGHTTMIDLKVGDQVISGQYSGDEVEIDKLKYKIVGFDYILAKLG
jgi:chaperonin GroES